MPFVKSYKTPNGGDSNFHLVTKVETSQDMTSLVLTVSSWASEADYLTGQPCMWSTRENRTIPVAMLAMLSDMITAEGTFAGASAVPDTNGSLDALKARKSAEINQARLKANRTTFEFEGEQISCDELSRSDIDGVQAHVARTGALPPNFPGFWKTAANTYVPVPDVATWDLFFAAMYQQGLANFMHSETLKAQLAAATTVEEVEAVQW